MPTFLFFFSEPMCLCVHSNMSAHKNTHMLHTHPHWASDHYKAIPPDRNPLNSLWFFGLHDIPFCLLSPQQPPTTAAAKNNTGAPLEPAPHHSGAWPQERDQNTHKKGNTSYCGRRGKRAFIQPRACRYPLMSLETKEPHTLMQQDRGRGKESVCKVRLLFRHSVSPQTAFICDSVSDLATSSIKTLTIS